MRVLTLDHPTPEYIWRMLVEVGRTLGVDYCVRIGKLYEFYAGEGSQIRLTPESAGRVRLDLWRDGERVATIFRSVELAPLARAVDELRTAERVG